jgi:predicted nucleotidyltransferase component of viral defense system
MTLLLQVLPYALKSSFLALKGGTAINLFYQNMPRLSVDIDLAYLQPDERNAALENIHQHLQQCKHAIEKDMGRTAYVQPVAKEGLWRKLNVHSSGAVVKIEPNDALRGVVEPAQTMDLCEAAQQEFSRFTSVRVLSTADLYGGKLCAALDRQHPRDRHHSPSRKKWRP